MQLCCNHLSKYYTRDKKRIPILKDINFSMSERDFIAIQGPSGCGKSTLLNILCGLLPYEEGEYTIDGQLINNNSAADQMRAKSIGVVVQNYALLPYATVLENIMLAKKDKLRALELLKLLHIDPLMKMKVAKLSGGEKQRVAIARALMISPQILMMDEPTGALDSQSRDDLMTLLTDLHTNHHTGLFLVTHDHIVAQHATTIIHMKDGELSQNQ